MKRYFYNYTIVEIANESDIILGSSIDEPNRFFPLTEEQNEFLDLNQTATAEEVINLKMNYGVVNPDIATLKILKTNPFLEGKTADEIRTVDVTMLLGLTNFKRFSRGYKVYSRYYDEPQTGTPIPIGNTWQDDGFTNCPAVERLYSLVWENNILVAEKVDMNWYNTDASLAFSKTTVNPLSAKDAAKKLKDIRETQILYLQNPESQYVNPTVKQYIDILFNHYKSEVSDYILSGNDAFLNAINGETNEQILQILSATLADGKTVKESILYQIVEP